MSARRCAAPRSYVSLPSEVLPEFREYERFSTTTADAYLAPRLAAYLGRLGGADRSESGGPPLAMQSSGGVTSVTTVSDAAGCVLSGPAGASSARLTWAPSAVTRTYSPSTWAVRARMAPILWQAQTTTETVVQAFHKTPHGRRPHRQRGGGSIAWADAGGALRVGPHSAGAEPGPPPTTWAAMTRGDRRQPLPRLPRRRHGLGGEVVLRRELSEKALAALGESLAEASDGRRPCALRVTRE